MVRAASSLLGYGAPAPASRSLDTEGRLVSLADSAVERATVVSIRCNHGPFVIHVRDGLAALARESTARGAAFVGINANDAREKSGAASELCRPARGCTVPEQFAPRRRCARRTGGAVKIALAPYNRGGIFSILRGGSRSLAAPSRTTM